jgi:hypothetical protein
MLQFLQIHGFQLYGLYSDFNVLQLSYIPHQIMNAYPWPNVLFVRDKLVIDKFGPAFEDWLNLEGKQLLQPQPG